MQDPYDLERFVRAQDRQWDDIESELRRGRKVTHWMWFAFPILEGLGRSDMAQRYALRDLDEARAYWAHPVLGPRLRLEIELAVAVPGKTAFQIFDEPDDWKFHCCLTVFAAALPDEPLFTQALERFFDGKPNDLATERIRELGS